MLKAFFAKFKKQEEIEGEKELTWHVRTVKFEKNNTNSITISEDEKSSLLVKHEHYWNPFTMKIAEEYLLPLCHDLNELKELCESKEYTFSISPLMNDFHKIKRRDVYIDPNREDNQVFDLDLFFNENGEIDSFAVGTRKRMYAYGGEPPYVFRKTSLNEFHLAMDYLKHNI